MVPLLVSVCFLPLVVGLPFFFSRSKLARGVIVAVFFAGFLGRSRGGRPEYSALTRVLSPTLADFAGGVYRGTGETRRGRVRRAGAPGEIGLARPACRRRSSSGPSSFLSASSERRLRAPQSALFAVSGLVSAAPLPCRALAVARPCLLPAAVRANEAPLVHLSGWFFAAFAHALVLNLARLTRFFRCWSPRAGFVSARSGLR
jgi:hypothetical protein